MGPRHVLKRFHRIARGFYRVLKSVIKVSRLQKGFRFEKLCRGLVSLLKRLKSPYRTLNRYGALLILEHSYPTLNPEKP